MMRCTRNDLALELRLAIELLIAEPSPDAYNQLSTMLFAMGKAKRFVERRSMIADFRAKAATDDGSYPLFGGAHT
ncbi:hypothetical protein [Collimonas sp. PA-H2]|uniref:hypothetical protein n=1 Tax=Collimonas sp. PA-H2 TaxID=1881062 RepID=UPI000BF6F085|nr:hypothetical protein [Collimonas sp. PA-H2]